MVLKVGDAVIVTAQGYKYSNQIGVIKNISGGTAHVMFENGNSSYKLDRLEEWNLPITNDLRFRIYKIKPSLLRLYNINANKKQRKEEKNMERLTDFKKVAMIEIGYKNYAYALYDDTIKVGDTVIVTGAASDRILIVKDIVDATDSNVDVNRITAEVKGKVDLTDYNNRVEKRQRKAELAKRMDKAIAEANELDKYTRYAEILGDDFKAMLDEFKTL